MTSRPSGGCGSSGVGHVLPHDAGPERVAEAVVTAVAELAARPPSSRRAPDFADPAAALPDRTARAGAGDQVGRPAGPADRGVGADRGAGTNHGRGQRRRRAGRARRDRAARRRRQLRRRRRPVARTARRVTGPGGRLPGRQRRNAGRRRPAPAGRRGAARATGADRDLALRPLAGAAPGRARRRAPARPPPGRPSRSSTAVSASSRTRSSPTTPPRRGATARPSRFWTPPTSCSA